ncbi:mediator of RNA polymerase II transcription subunit 20 isoform X2 [Apteryx rowi]|uniref:mediator of RNA polymerase II transcription subunit 20 isoform X2 n=2 Tax=Apteryx rowi TaxID=308060 RepID=UPI000E1E1904|nr:mediator of RNA polymerase II transcription subunit 20 isoform X2 [Apteryx rowi]
MTQGMCSEDSAFPLDITGPNGRAERCDLICSPEGTVLLSFSLPSVWVLTAFKNRCELPSSVSAAAEVSTEPFQPCGSAQPVSRAGQTGKLMYVMHNSEYPLSCFALFENGPCLIADANFDILMVKLKGFFQNAKANKIESRGTRYQYCDFLVKVGTVTMGPSARGISVEVEYCPCVIANDCWNLLIEFMQSFMGSHTPGIPSVFGTKHDSIYSPADTMVQYMELFNKIRKQQQVPVAGIR